MNNTSVKIAIACFLGSTIGAFIALQLASCFWWLGVLIGGVTSYISYSFKEIPTTMKMLWNSMPEKENVCVFFGVIMYILLIVLCVVIAILAIVTAVASIGNFFDVISKGCNHAPFVHSYLFWIGGTVTMILAVGLIEISNTEGSIEDLRVVQILLLAFSPPLAFISMSVIGICVAGGIMYFLYRLCKIVYKLFLRTFKIIHSDIRLLCMADSVVGAMTGYLCGNALIGGIVGLIAGVINYKVISVRWLKLAVHT